MQAPVDERKAKEMEYVNAAKSYVRLNIWYAGWSEWLKPDPGHVSLRIFDGQAGELTDISFYPESDNSIHFICSRGNPVPHTFDKFNMNSVPANSPNEKKGIKAAGKTPDVILYFYTLDVKKMLACWNSRKNNSTYSLFASLHLNPLTNYRCNPFANVHNCLTMAQTILEAGGFKNLLNQFHNHQSGFDKVVSYFPALGSFVGGVLGVVKNQESATFSPSLCFKLLGYLSAGYFIGRALGSYAYLRVNNYENSTWKNLANIFWKKIPHKSKDWVATTPEDFVSKAIAAYIVEYNTCSADDQREHDNIREIGRGNGGAYFLDLVDILAERLARDEPNNNAEAARLAQ